MKNNSQSNTNQPIRLDDTGNRILYDKKGNIRKVHFWVDGLSINESKVSTLIVCLLACISFAGYIYINKGDISNNLTTLTTTLIWGIAGVNIADKISGMVSHNANANNEYNNYDAYGNLIVPIVPNNQYVNNFNPNVNSTNQNTNNIDPFANVEKNNLQ